MSRRVLETAVVAALLALFAWRELAAMRADGPTVDEGAHLAYGERGLERGTFDREGPMLNSKMPVSVLNALPVAAAARLGVAADGRRRLWLGRLPTVALGLLLGWLVWHWARALFGARGGVLGLFLYTFCPNVLAHSHLVTTDLATALGMFAATYAFWRYRQRPGAWRLAVAAAAFGAAQLTKVTALFLVPIFLLIVLLELVRARLMGVRPAATAGPRLVLRALLPAAALLAGAIVALDLGFAGEKMMTPLSGFAPVSRPFQALAAVPLLRDVPMPVPLPYLTGLDMVTRDARAGSPSYLHGRLSARGFWDYYLVAALIKVPAGTLALLALAAWLAVTGRVRVPAAEAFLLVPPAFLLAYLSFAFELQIGLRYLLPALPFLFVFAGRAAAWQPAVSPGSGSVSLRLPLGEGSKSREPAVPAAPRPKGGGGRRSHYPSPGGAAVGLLAAWTGVSSLASHPRYIPYFNELIGGQSHGYRWLSDSNVDWGQDDDYMHEVYARRSPVRLWIEPGGPIAGRVAVALRTLVPRHLWLRDHFQPAALVRGSWAIYDVTAEQIERCCAGEPQAWPVPDDAGNLAPGGQGIGGSDSPDVGVRFLEKLNDGMLGANSTWDAARSSPLAAPVVAWFGIAWPGPRQVGRVTAYPGFFSRGPESRRFLALDYVLQWWDGRAWVDLPGTRVTGNRRLHVEHSFPPVRTTRVRLRIERERNEQGTEAAPGVFRATCLELAVYPR